LIVHMLTDRLNHHLLLSQLYCTPATERNAIHGTISKQRDIRTKCCELVLSLFMIKLASLNGVMFITTRGSLRSPPWLG